MRAMPICGSRRVAPLAMRPQRRLAFSQSAALGSRPVHICQGRRPCESVQRQRVILRAEPSNPGDKGTAESANELQVVKQEGFLGGLMKRLRDFGFGKKSIWEGGVGLFILAGIGLGFGLATWARGARFNSANGYRMTIEFPEACGMTVGTPVRVRGVQVGSVLTVRPHLDKVEALVEVLDANTVIPKNSEILANQSGLIAEPLVDITPKTPIPSYQATPVEPECEAEGVIVCENGRIAGQRGVALDDLVYICTQLAQQMNGQGGMDMMFDTARIVSATVEEARPLLTKAAALLDEVNPLLADIRSSSLVQVGNMEALTKTAADAAADIQKLQGALLDDENTKALRQSVTTLTRTLQHIEHIAGDVGVMTGDSKVRANLKQLIDALSRLIDD